MNILDRVGEMRELGVNFEWNGISGDFDVVNALYLPMADALFYVWNREFSRGYGEFNSKGE